MIIEVTRVINQNNYYINKYLVFNAMRDLESASLFWLDVLTRK